MARNRTLAAVFLIAVIVTAGSGVGIWWYLSLAPHYEPPPSDGDGDGNGNHAPLPPNPYNFSLVFQTGGFGDHGVNDGCYKGALDARNTYGLNFTYAEPTTIAQYEPMLRNYANHTDYATPFDLIICIGFDAADALMNVAADYPTQNFAILDMWIDPATSPNVASLLFNEHEGSALAGALAGLYTTKNKLGFIGGMSTPIIHKYGAGYFWGANLTNPALAVNPVTQSPSCIKGYVGEWSNIVAGKALADVMYQTNGTDIIFAAAGRSGLGVIASAVDNNASLGPIWAIGSDSPQMYLGCADPQSPAPPTVVLTSMLKRFDIAVYDIVYNACIAGTFTGGMKILSLANGGVGWEYNPALKVIPLTYITKLSMIAQGIINGTYTVPQTYPWLP